MRLSRPTFLLPIIAASFLAVGCGSDSDSDSDKDGGSKKDSKTSSSIATPAPLKAGGDFVVCTDVPYPPAEFMEGTKFVGYEIDFMTEVADRIGTKAVYEKTLFDAIIPSLNAKKCDAIISSMNVTPDRAKQVNFVEYMEIGQSLMVRKGEGDGISSLDDLSGKSVAVQVGTTLKDALDARSKELKAAGKKPIKVETFPDGGAAAAALKTDKVDVFFADSPVVADYVNKDADAFEFAGEPIDALAVGIALRKDDTEMNEAIQKAVDAMYSDGTVVDIFSEWNVQDFVLTNTDSSDEA
ncbi:MAG: ABC transporter substrate-binding protein [Gaiellales bacterium]